jgi:hypothetical protein
MAMPVVLLLRTSRKLIHLGPRALNQFTNKEPHVLFEVRRPLRLALGNVITDMHFRHSPSQTLNEPEQRGEPGGESTSDELEILTIDVVREKNPSVIMRITKRCPSA